MPLKPAMLRLADTRELSYIERGDPQGIPLIFLHGLADSCHTFDLLFACFPKWLHALAYTQRGHDGVDLPALDYRTQDFEADLLQFMDAKAIEKAFIAGASSGGFAARNFAAKYPEQTLGLILIGSPSELGNHPEIVAIHDSTLWHLTDPVSPEFIRKFTGGLYNKPVPADFLERMFHEIQKVPARVWRETSEAALNEKFPGLLHQVTAPALVISGTEDPIASQEDQQKLSAAIANSHLCFLPQLGHMLYWEGPTEVAKSITRFVVKVQQP
ncbi:alpha/beta hydrolase [Planococcus sp. CP5-4]|uniref:alpha/beta fold hydrolase n=1 Tax=unclassified Planococcus (in: firmicutes) TaxID=2662419 RepID=UPI001C2306CA|nr:MULTISPECIES: alpha/beta hydrolase [unclassified Planococcus (in: firmicutes)]MBU9673769.1 alpha/beta hydrolase [Planococcus sp. CP5-4_YE]MBV0908893.1 alpha/beta hydrolase [Planococcus sp. CP5-4_UN]MBW6063942.1 alpha/beta hydrolase [Planococcus sp. CP5-4]